MRQHKRRVRATALPTPKHFDEPAELVARYVRTARPHIPPGMTYAHPSLSPWRICPLCPANYNERRRAGDDLAEHIRAQHYLRVNPHNYGAAHMQCADRQHARFWWNVPHVDTDGAYSREVLPDWATQAAEWREEGMSEDEIAEAIKDRIEGYHERWIWYWIGLRSLDTLIRLNLRIQRVSLPGHRRLALYIDNTLYATLETVISHCTSSAEVFAACDLWLAEIQKPGTP